MRSSFPALTGCSVDSEARNVALEARWAERHAGFERVFLYLERARQLEKAAGRAQAWRRLRDLLDEADGLLLGVQELRPRDGLVEAALARLRRLRAGVDERRAKELARLERRLDDVLRAREHEFDKAVLVVEVGQFAVFSVAWATVNFFETFFL